MLTSARPILHAPIPRPRPGPPARTRFIRADSALIGAYHHPMQASGTFDPINTSHSSSQMSARF